MDLDVVRQNIKQQFSGFTVAELVQLAVNSSAEATLRNHQMLRVCFMTPAGWTRAGEIPEEWTDVMVDVPDDLFGDGIDPDSTEEWIEALENQRLIFLEVALTASEEVYRRLKLKEEQENHDCGEDRAEE